MAWQPVAGLLPQYQKPNGDLASGYYLKFYAKGTSDAILMATDDTGGTQLAKCQINASGYPVTDASATFVPHLDQDYRVQLYPTAADADADTNGIWSALDLTPIAPTSASSKSVATVAEMTADTTATLGDLYTVEDYATGRNSGVMFFKVVAAGTGTEDLGKFFDHDTLSLQFEQNCPLEINMKRFGMVGDGITPDSTQFQRLSDYTNNIIVDADSTFLINTQITRSAGNFYMRGVNRRTSIIRYLETDATAMMLIRDAGNIVSTVQLRNFTVTGGDTATGGAFEIEDVSAFYAEDLFIEDFSAAPSTNFGIKFRGREFIRCKRFEAKDVTKPLLFLDNPNASTLDNDIVHLSDLYLNVSDKANGIGVDFQGSSNTSITIDGQNSIAVAFHGIRVQNTSTADSLDLKISNTRIEQSDSAFARGVLTLTGNALDTETVVIGAKTYTFQTTLTNVDGNVLIGATASDTLDNLASAMNLTAGAGSTYAAATTAHPDSITAQALDGDALGVGAGTDGTQSTTETLTNGTWGAATLKQQADTGYMVYLNQPGTSKFQNVIIDNLRASNDNNGFYLRNCSRVSIRNTSISGGYGHESLNVDNSCDFLVFENFLRPTEAQETNTGLSDFKIETSDSSVEYWSNDAAVNLSSSQGVHFQTPINLLGGSNITPSSQDNLMVGLTINVADNGSISPLPFPADVQGWFIASAADSTGGNRAFAIGQFDDASTGGVILHVSNNASTTAGTASSLNIHKIGAQIRVENKLGAATDVSITGSYTLPT